MKRILLLVAALGAAAAAYLVLRGDTPAPGVSRPTDGSAGGGVADDRTGDTRSGAGAAESRTGDTRRPGDPRLPPRPVTLGDGDAGPTGLAAPPAAGGAISFDNEAVDPAWAADQERELTLRLRRVVDDLSARGAVVDIDAVECRRTMCRIAIHARDTGALGKLYGSLESPEGLYGWADNVLLESVEAELDGQVKTRVTAIFERE